MDAVPEDLAEDDEKELSVVHPARLAKFDPKQECAECADPSHRLEKRSCAVGAAWDAEIWMEILT